MQLKHKHKVQKNENGKRFLNPNSPFLRRVIKNGFTQIFTQVL